MRNQREKSSKTKLNYKTSFRKSLLSDIDRMVVLGRGVKWNGATSGSGSSDKNGKKDKDKEKDKKKDSKTPPSDPLAPSGGKGSGGGTMIRLLIPAAVAPAAVAIVRIVMMRHCSMQMAMM